MIGSVIGEKVQNFLMALFSESEHISYGIVSTTTNVLLSRSEDLLLKNIKTIPMWGRSIFQSLNFERRWQQSQKWKSLKGQEKKQGSIIIFVLLTL